MNRPILSLPRPKVKPPIGENMFAGEFLAGDNVMLDGHWRILISATPSRDGIILEWDEGGHISSVTKSPGFVAPVRRQA